MLVVPIAVLLVTAHLLAVGCAAAGPLVCLLMRRQAARSGEPQADEIARRLAVASFGLLVAGGVLGLAAGALLWAAGNEPYFEALARIPTRRLWSSAAEMLFSLVVSAVYALAWSKFVRRRKLHALLAVATGTNLLYHFPTLFSMLAVLSTREPAGEGPVDFRALLVDPEIASRTIHHVLTAWVVACLALVVVARRAAGGEQFTAAARRAMVWGGRGALVAAALQMAVGLLLLTEMQPASQHALLGRNVPATLSLGLAIMVALAWLPYLGRLALGETEGRVPGFAVGLGIAVIFLMVATHHLVRREMFAERAMTAAAETRSAISLTANRALP